MATNPWFSSYNYFNEQQLIDDLVIESIKIYGVDTWYLSRDLQHVDEILNETTTSIFNRAHEMEMYIKSVDGFQGEGDFLSRFGLQIRDQIVFTVAIRTFEQHATRNQPELIRPLEGDLVYMPMNRKFFKVMHVEHESVFYQTGALQVYDLKCELFEYSNERFQTGNPIIDEQFANYETASITALDDLFDVDPLAQNLSFEEKGNEIVDFTEVNPFEEIITSPTNT
jgi:hypothetical protein